MSRVLLVAIGAVILAFIAFAVFVIGSGGPQRAPVATLDDASAPPSAASGAAGDEAAEAAFELWAGSLRALGLAVSAEEVLRQESVLLARGLIVSGPEDTGWQWRSEEARIEDAEPFTLNISGAQSVTLTDGAIWTGIVESIGISAAPGENGGTIVHADIAGLTLGSGDGIPLTLAAGDIRLAAVGGEALLPAGSVLTVAFSDLTHPGWAESPFGASVERLSAEARLLGDWTGFVPVELSASQPDAGHSLDITDLTLNWGALQLVGTGGISLDTAGRPVGALEVEIGDVLTALDAVHAARGLDRGVLAQTYATLLIEMASGTEPSGTPATITIDDGVIRLESFALGQEIIGLGTVAPLINLLPAQ